MVIAVYGIIDTLANELSSPLLLFSMMRNFYKKKERKDKYKKKVVGSRSTVFSVVRVARSLVFCVMFCRSLFVLLSFFFWPSYCLSFDDVRLLITSLWYLYIFLHV